MVSVNGAKLVLDGTDGLILKELSYLLCVVKSRMSSRGIYTQEQIDDVIKNAVSNAEFCELDDLRSDAKMAAEQIASKRMYREN